jgi:hypothetical protein
VLGCGDAIYNLRNNMGERADVIVGRGDSDVISPQERTFRDLAKVNRRGDVNTRVGLEPN